METTTMDHSEKLGDLAKALAKAQATLKDASKDATNPHFKNRYATLASVRAALTAVLPGCGLSVVQSFEPHGDAGVCVVTWLLHESGQWLRSRLYLPVGKKDAQGFGSAISYGRRYALAAIVGIAADDDDDANAAVPRTNGAGPAKAEPNPEAEAKLAAMLDGASTVDELAKAEAAAARAVKAGELTDEARSRLRARRAEAVRRMDAA